jgi:hypothetical protein
LQRSSCELGMSLWVLLNIVVINLNSCPGKIQREPGGGPILEGECLDIGTIPGMGRPIVRRKAGLRPPRTSSRHLVTNYRAKVNA